MPDIGTKSVNGSYGSDHESRPIGLLYANDALQVLLKQTEYEKLLLHDYVMGVGYR
ncbi:histidine kinase [Alcaligenaceae bacterium]|nr:histidine kinase [Alcaligenaceae bacterium]